MTVQIDDEKIYIKFDNSKVKRTDADRSKAYRTIGEWYDDIEKRKNPHYSDIMPLYYSRKQIEDHLKKKLNNTFLCLRKNKTINKIVHYKFTEWFILQNIIKSKIDNMYKNGLYFDIGARTNHNHGTKLRMRKDNLFELFNNSEIVF
jgi:hypothetical protein